MISIVTGTLNRKHLLPYIINNTIETNDKLELVLVDGGSTDGTIEYIKSLNNKQIKLIEIGHRSSYSHFMNIGIKNSKYDYICQWNDDVLLINRWEEIISELDNNDYYIFPWCRGDLSLYNGNKINEILKLDKILFYHCMNFGIYNKQVFDKIGYYDENFHFYCADEDMTYRCMNFDIKGKILYNIRVFEIDSINGQKILKNNYDDTEDRQILYKNISKYKNKML